jgi:hypothetical protein
MDEAHSSAYSIHPGTTKMYLSIKEKYWWDGMKGDIARFVVECERIKKNTRRPVINCNHSNSSLEVG